MRSFLGYFVLILIFFSCSSKNTDIFDIKKGMHKNEVISLIGKPTEQIVLINVPDGQGSLEMWHYGENVLQFGDGKVLKTAKEVKEENLIIKKMFEEKALKK